MAQEKLPFAASPKKLEEGIDFYLENGLFVFTRRFLLERGFCCESGCRHCPYGFQKEKAAESKPQR